MRRFFVNPGELNESTVELTGDEFHHLKNVSRLEEGERVELLDGQGNTALAEIESLGKKAATLKIKSLSKLPQPKPPRLSIVLGVPRFQKMDLIVQKCVELGAYEIIPVVSDRSFVKKISKDLDGKVARWRKIANEACKQSGRAWPLELREFSTLNDELKKNLGAGVFLYEGEGSSDIKKQLTSFKTVPQELKIFIGAEGGFSPVEVETFRKVGLEPVTLGPLVLRVETACIAILSVIQYHFDLMR